MIRALSYSKTLGYTNDIIIKLQRILQENGTDVPEYI